MIVVSTDSDAGAAAAEESAATGAAAGGWGEALLSTTEVVSAGVPFDSSTVHVNASGLNDKYIESGNVTYLVQM